MDSKKLALVLVLSLVVFLKESEAIATGWPEGRLPPPGKRQIFKKVRISHFEVKIDIFNEVDRHRTFLWKMINFYSIDLFIIYFILRIPPNKITNLQNADWQKDIHLVARRLS